MFGVIPKTLWEKRIPADDKNRIHLALRCLLLRSADRIVLVDNGAGTKWSEKERAIFGLEGIRPIDEALAKFGIAPLDVTDVILTHLHFDHAGGTTEKDAAGAERLTFPNATHHVQRRNWAWANAPTERDRGSYRPENFRLLDGHAKLRLLDGEVEILPGIRAILSDGHTTGLQTIRVEGPEGSITYCADLIPTSAHLSSAWGMSYDLRPLQLIDEKKAAVERAIAEDGILFFEHDPKLQAARVRREGHEIKAIPVTL